MTSKQILIVEDEKPIRDMIAFGLRRAGFDVREAEDSSGARASIADHRPDLMLVDWMLPDQSGLELTRAVKRNKDTEDLPVIMLTARADEHDKVSGLEGGADDYVTKPSARANCWRGSMRCCGGRRRPATGTIEAGGLTLDTASHRVTAGDQTVTLGPTEYRLLQFFMEHPERVTRAASSRPHLGRQRLCGGRHPARSGMPATDPDGAGPATVSRPA
jgi:two-component system phosphate regulon response regulator PhoB